MRQALIPALLAVAVAVVAFVTAVASGAPNKPAITFIDPSPSEGATLTTSSVQFAFTYNRTPGQTHSLVCSLSGPTSSSGPCDTPVASGAGSQSGKSYSGLLNGSYTFSVTLKANGPMASATRHFSIALPVGRHIYWGSTSTGAIGRANVDGTGVNQSFIASAPGGPVGVAVDSNYVYWAKAGPNTIGRANLDGTGANQSFISGASGSQVAGVAVDSNYVYWSNNGLLVNTIGRANLDGTGVNQSFITGASFPVGVAVDSNYLYWANLGTSDAGTNTIGRANLDGTGVNQSFITGGSHPAGVAVDSNYVYWANRGTDCLSPGCAIGRANLDGTGVNQSFITVPNGPRDVAVDSSSIYWSNQQGANTIGRANLDGTGVNQSFITPTSGSATGVAVDAG